MSATKDQKRQVLFSDVKSDTLPRMNTKNNPLENTMIVQKFTFQSPPNTAYVQTRKTSISQERSSVKPNDNKTNVRHSFLPSIDDNKDRIHSPINGHTTDESDRLINQKLVFNRSQSLNDTITSNQNQSLNNTINNNNRDSDDRTELYTIENAKKITENQPTLDLLAKIKQIPSAVSIGPMPLSQQACRFELPFDLKILENMTPLGYLSRYCRLSPRRQYQFRRLFDKYRNRQYRFESSSLYLSIVDIHKENYNQQKFHYLCQLIDLNNQEYQFTFDTYAGILALCERILYKSSPFYDSYYDYYFTKDTLEKCDFYSLERKLDGLNISDPMKRLLNVL